MRFPPNGSTDYGDAKTLRVSSPASSTPIPILRSEQESLADAKVSARQQCMYEISPTPPISSRQAASYLVNSYHAVLLTVCGIFRV